MAIAYHKVVTSIEAIKDSILTDRYVFRWFAHLLTQPKVKDPLRRSSDCEKTYKQLRQLTRLHALLHSTLLVTLYFLIVIKSLWIVIPIIVVNIVSVKIGYKKQGCVARLSEAALLQDRSAEEVSKMTLYQISEVYARQLGIPSLVDTIYVIDRALRRTIIWMFVLTCFIYPVNYWTAFFLIAVTFLMVRLIYNLTVFYKRLV